MLTDDTPCLDGSHRMPPCLNIPAHPCLLCIRGQVQKVRGSGFFFSLSFRRDWLVSLFFVSVYSYNSATKSHAVPGISGGDFREFIRSRRRSLILSASACVVRVTTSNWAMWQNFNQCHILSAGFKTRPGAPHARAHERTHTHTHTNKQRHSGRKSKSLDTNTPGTRWSAVKRPLPFTVSGVL